MIGVAKISMKVFHMSAVKLEKPSPVAILTGRRPRSLEIFIVSAHFCNVLSFSRSNTPPSIQSFVTIHLATPRKRQCMGSITQRRTGLK